MTRVEIADRQALATVFLILWVAIVLNPVGLKRERRLLVGEGFIMPKGPLKLTARGERVMAIAKGRKT